MSWDIGFELKDHDFVNYSWNYTHNCNNMMRDAGFNWIYDLQGKKVIDTIDNFEHMLANLKANPEKFRAMNPPNGWGDYDSLVALWEDEIIPAAKCIANKFPEVTWWECS